MLGPLIKTVPVSFYWDILDIFIVSPSYLEHWVQFQSQLRTREIRFVCDTINRNKISAIKQ